MPGKLLKNVKWPVKVPESRTDKIIYSSKFTIEHQESITTWKLACNFNKLRTYIAVYLRPSGYSMPNFDVSYDLMILNHEDAEKSKLCSIESKSTDWNSGYSGFGNSKFLSYDELDAKDSNFVKNGKICIVATIRECIDVEPMEVEMTAMHEFLPSVVAEGFELITLNCADGVKLKAFKEIIAAKSEVLGAIFSTDMQEKQQIGVKVVDFNSDVMAEFLRFLYMGKVQRFDTIDMELYEVAEKFLVEDLKAACLESIKARLCFENIVEIWKFSDMHGEDDLYESCLVIIYKFYIIPKIAPELIIDQLPDKLQIRIYKDLNKISREENDKFCKLRY